MNPKVCEIEAPRAVHAGTLPSRGAFMLIVHRRHTRHPRQAAMLLRSVLALADQMPADARLADAVSALRHAGPQSRRAV